MSYVTLSNVISNRILDNNGWRDMLPEERINALETIKIELLATGRIDTQYAKSISRMSVDNLPKNIGIFDRVTTVGYIPGQDYPSELRYIKNTIRRQC